MLALEFEYLRSFYGQINSKTFIYIHYPNIQISGLLFQFLAIKVLLFIRAIELSVHELSTKPPLAPHVHYL